MLFRGFDQQPVELPDGGGGLSPPAAGGDDAEPVVIVVEYLLGRVRLVVGGPEAGLGQGLALM